jgi:hypothetical protein
MVNPIMYSILILFTYSDNYQIKYWKLLADVCCQSNSLSTNTYISPGFQCFVHIPILLEYWDIGLLPEAPTSVRKKGNNFAIQCLANF